MPKSGFLATSTRALLRLLTRSRNGYLALPPATRWIWTALALFLLLGLGCWDEMRSPSQTAWFRNLAEAKRPSFKTYLAVGLWYGTLVHLTLLGILVATVRWWGRGHPVRYEMSLLKPTNSFWTAHRFFIALALLCTVAALIRWPRMSLSYWGDEGWAVAPYVYGKHIPVDPNQPQGPLVHKPVDWLNTAFDDRTGGNHYLFSLLQRATLTGWRWMGNLPPDAFDESISRLPPLAAGLASIALLALWLRWLGRPGVGLASALLLALHPWHLRYSTEARGYSLMLLFLILALWLACVALKTGRWRWWLAFGTAEFLCMYSWKGVMYPLALANLVLLAWIICGRRMNCGLPDAEAVSGSRATSLWRWLVASLIAAGWFINLVYPCVLQLKDSKQQLVQLSGRPMGRIWFHNTLSGVFTGTPWHVEDKRNPTEQVLEKHLQSRPLLTGVGLVSTVFLLGIGTVALASSSRWLAGLQLAVFSGGILGALSFRYLVHAEWISWYSFFMILPLAVCGGFGIAFLSECFRRPQPESTALFQQPGRVLPQLTRVTCLLLVLTLPAAQASLMFPVTKLMVEQAYENYRGAFELTRGQHEALHHCGSSNVHTLYLWRYISLYDPRGDTHVRKMEEFRERVAEVEKTGAELYMVVGHQRLARKLNPTLLGIIENPVHFDHLGTLWAVEELHNLHCYRFRKGSLPPTNTSETAQ